MQGFLVRRLLLILPTLFLASLVIFAIITLAPGDPVRMMLGTQATPAEVAQERTRLGLDRPVPVRYGIWMTHVLRLDLGRSQVNNQPVAALVLQAFRTFLGTSPMMAYLAMMAPRLGELHRVLKPTGSLYLHCDPSAGHYLKVLLDAVFGRLHGGILRHRHIDPVIGLPARGL